MVSDEGYTFVQEWKQQDLVAGKNKEKIAFKSESHVWIYLPGFLLRVDSRSIDGFLLIVT